MKYAKHLKCLCFIARCAKYLYYIKKVLCAFALVIAAALGVKLIIGGGRRCKMLREWM